MKEIVIVGAGGLGKVVQWMIERINRVEATWKILGYADDGIAAGSVVDDLPILGAVDGLLEADRELAVVCAVASAGTRRRIIRKLSGNPRLTFPNVIDPSVIRSDRIGMGTGNIIGAGSILTVDIRMGDFCIITEDCTVGHDVTLGSYVTLYPSVNVSGCVTVGSGTELGTGCHVIQGLTIGDGTIVGAGTVAIRDLPGNCTVVGNPARIVKTRPNG